MRLKTLSFLIIVFLLSAPVWLAAGPLPAGEVGAPESLVPCTGEEGNKCDFTQLTILIQNVLNFLITLSVSVAAIAIMIGGWYMVTARGSESQLSQGKKIIGAAVVGLIIVLGAWLIVTAIIKFLGVDESVIKLPSDPAP